MKKSLGPKIFACPTPVWIIGTYDEKGKPNLMTAAWAGVCCSEPPCIYISLRKATYSYGNIMKRKAFTANIPSQSYAVEADYAGIVSGRNEDKFSSTNLTPVKSTIVDAPYIEEASLIMECEVIHTIEIGLHTEFIGEIQDAKADFSVLDRKGLPRIKKVKPMIFAPGLSKYYAVGSFLGKAFTIGKKLAVKNP